MLDAIPERRTWLRDWRTDVGETAQRLAFLKADHPMHGHFVKAGDDYVRENPAALYSPRHATQVAKIVVADLLLAGTHKLVPRSDGSIDLVRIRPVNGSNGHKTSAAPAPAGIRQQTTTSTAAAIPIRRDTPAARLTERKQISDDPQERFDADMDDFFDQSFR